MDVALVQWPSDEELRQELAEQGQPRLLLVEPEADPPVCVDSLEDWVRLPVSRVDRNARIRALESRNGAMTSPIPAVDRFGTLEFGGKKTHLTAIQARVVELLVERFGGVVGREPISEHVWPDGETPANTLDVAMGRLRRQLQPVGLEVKTVRSRGYLLHAASDPR